MGCVQGTKLSTDKVLSELERQNINVVAVPKNMNHLLQPLDLTTNASVKKMEKRGFSDYFTSTITETLEKDPQRDVTTVEVDLKLSTLKPIHAKLLMSIYEFLQGEKGRKIILNGWKAAGITEAVESARKGRNPTLDPLKIENVTNKTSTTTPCASRFCTVARL